MEESSEDVRDCKVVRGWAPRQLAIFIKRKKRRGRGERRVAG